VFGFVICESFKHSHDALLDDLREFGLEYGIHEMPNIIVSLNDGFIQSVMLHYNTRLLREMRRLSAQRNHVHLRFRTRRWLSPADFSAILEERSQRR